MDLGVCPLSSLLKVVEACSVRQLLMLLDEGVSVPLVTLNIRSKFKNSETGNRTLVIRVTGGYTNHYTISDLLVMQMRTLISGLGIPTVGASCCKYAVPEGCSQADIFVESFSGLQECLMSRLSLSILDESMGPIRRKAAAMVGGFLQCNKEAQEANEAYAKEYHDIAHHHITRGFINHPNNHISEYYLVVFKTNSLLDKVRN